MGRAVTGTAFGTPAELAAGPGDHEAFVHPSADEAAEPSAGRTRSRTNGRANGRASRTRVSTKGRASGRLGGGMGGTIRSRVARILALPAVVVLALLSLLAAEQIQQQQSAQDVSRSVRLGLAVQSLVHELQTERGITAAVLSGNASFRSELAPARRLVDRQQAVVRSLVGTGTGAPARIRSAVNRLSDLGAHRASTDSGKATAPATFNYFTARIAALSNVDLGLDDSSDPQLRSGVATLQALQDLAEATSQERAFLNGVFSAGGFASGEFVQFAQMRANRQSALERFNRSATAEQRRANAFVFSTGAAQVTANFEQVAIAAADGRHIVVNPQSWWSGLTTVLDDLTQLQQHVGSQIRLRAHDLQLASAQRIGGLLAVVLLCFAGSIYLAALASRSITRPLAALADEADDVALTRLPTAVRQLQTDEAFDAGELSPPAAVQIPPRATSEIRSVATALDRLQSVAYGLASDQAGQRRDTIESMANLGRRNQNLIRRQLGFITALERDEIDPSGLANLFELDHLATRMRRNAASLLVLVGASSPRQWSTPVSVADMIRAAVSEVEEYRRVTLRRVDEAFVSGVAVGSIAHLLAELIENGLAFSPPDTDVEIQGRRMADGYLIAITDQGVGMSNQDLAKANARLQGEGDFIASPTRFLGHFVVGKLAREAQVDVELLPSPVTGVTARIMLPLALLSASSTPVDVRPLTDTGSQPRHSLASAPAEIPAEIEPPRPALPQRQEQYEPPDGTPRMPPPWGVPVAARRTPASGSLIDADATPSNGLSIPGRPHTASGAHSATERTITERTITERIATERTMTGPAAQSGQRAGQSAQSPLTPHPRALRPSDVSSHPVIIPSTPVPAASAKDADERTRNGLRKRIPRTQESVGGPPTPSAGSARRVIDLDAPGRSPALDPSPAEISARMTALRAGVQRGRSTQVSPAFSSKSDRESGRESEDSRRSAEDDHDPAAEGPE